MRTRVRKPETPVTRQAPAARQETGSGAARDAEARDVAETVGSGVRAVPQQQLGQNADVVIAATPFPEQVDAVRASGNLSGKIVIEISNPMKPDMSGLLVGHTSSAAEEVAKEVPGAKVVKAFNTVFAQVLGGPASGAGQVQVFYAGDDEEAKQTARSLIESMGFDAIDAGPLRNARILEPVGMLNIYLGYVAEMGTDIAPAFRKVAQAGDGARVDHAARESERARTTARRDQEDRPSPR